jgi:hypothetical protein
VLFRFAVVVAAAAAAAAAVVTATKIKLDTFLKLWV